MCFIEYFMRRERLPEKDRALLEIISRCFLFAGDAVRYLQAEVPLAERRYHLSRTYYQKAAEYDPLNGHLPFDCFDSLILTRKVLEPAWNDTFTGRRYIRLYILLLLGVRVF